MLAYVNWAENQEQIHSAIKTGFPNQRFVSTRRIWGYMQEHPKKYPLGKLPPKACKYHISATLRRDVLKAGWTQRNWNERQQRASSQTPVWVVPWVAG